MGYQLPVIAPISSSWQDHKDRQPPSQEPGTDYGCAYGTTVVAPEAGTIVDTKSTNGGATGRYLTIDLDDGRRVRFLHLSQILVWGGRVARGQAVAVSGASANGSDWGVGAHVHVTLWPGHTYVFGPDGTLDFQRYVGPADGAPGNAEGATTALKGTAWVTAIQDKYRRMGHDLGPAGVDGVDGPRFVQITKFEQARAATTSYGALTVDGIAGDKTNAFLDWSLTQPAADPAQYHTATVADIASLPNTRGLQKIAKLYGYQGDLDNDFGPGSQAGLQAFLNQAYGGSLAHWLRTRWGYIGNDQWGPVMAAAATRAEAENWTAL